VSLRLVFVLVAMAAAWILMCFLLLFFFTFGDCFDDQCRAQQLLNGRIILALTAVSYVLCVVLVVRSGEGR